MVLIEILFSSYIVELERIIKFMADAIIILFKYCL